MAIATRKRILAPLITSSTWLGAWRSVLESAMARGKAMKNQPGPPMTNAEVVAWVRVWRGVSTSAGELWAQFAARAYGWNQPTGNRLNRSAAAAAAWHPTDDVVDVWEWSKGIATELDARGDQPPPSLAPNLSTWSDPVFQGEVMAALAQDGITVTFGNGKPTTSPKREPAPTPESSFPPLLLILGAWWLITRKKKRSRRN